MVIARTFNIVAGDKIPDVRQTIIDIKKDIQHRRASSTTARDRVKNLSNAIDRKTEMALRQIKPINTFINASRNALDGPRTGGGSAANRIQKFVTGLKNG